MSKEDIKKLEEECHYLEDGYYVGILENEKKELEQENKQLKSILTELEEWLNKEKGYYLCGRSNGKTLLYGKELKRIETIEKIKELKEKYKC